MPCVGGTLKYIYYFFLTHSPLHILHIAARVQYCTIDRDLRSFCPGSDVAFHAYAASTLDSFFCIAYPDNHCRPWLIICPAFFRTRQPSYSILRRTAASCSGCPRVVDILKRLTMAYFHIRISSATASRTSSENLN